MRRIIACALGAVAAGVETLSAIWVFHPDHGEGVYLAPFGHLVATAACVVAARIRTGCDSVDQDAVVVTALFVPVFGPSLAWMFPAEKDPDALVNAHAYFERFEDLSARSDVGGSCLPEEGAFEASQLHPLSFAEILRHGSTAHKRNALSKLAELGGPRHLRMLRKVLVSESGELRLCAFIELSRIARRFEDQIAELHKKLLQHSEESGGHVHHDLLTQLAEIHYGFANSGLLDVEMERYHLRQTIRAVEEAWRVTPEDCTTARIRAMALSDSGDHDEAIRTLGRLSDRDQARIENRIARANIAFRMRDFDTVREQAEALAATGLPPPDWMAAMQPEETDEEEEAPSAEEMAT